MADSYSSSVIPDGVRAEKYTQTAPLFKSEDSASSEQFGIGATGQIRTNQSANATTPGSVVKQLAMFDASGNSLGYIPIYDAIT